MERLSWQIAAFTSGLTLDSLPEDVTELARICLLNAYGIALCGLDTPYAPVARKAAISMDGERRSGGATMLGDGRRTSIAGACLANGALFHGRAQEDTTGAAHFGTVLVPLLTALIESRDVSLADFLPALVAGYEAGGLVEQALARSSTPAGFRSTAVYGTIAAAAACARLMRLPTDQTASALEHAVSFAGGVLQSFAEGTDEWRYQPGVVARNGWVAAELAAAGGISAPHAFEGAKGLGRAFGSMDLDVSALVAKLGQQWAIRRVTFKPFPVCAFNQTPVTAALAIASKIDIASLEAVRVRMNPFETGYAGMDAVGPFRSISGTLMSIPFCVATTLVHGAPSMARMIDFDDDAVNLLEKRITLITDPDVPTLTSVIEADLASGETVSHRQSMTEIDYQYDRQEVIAMLGRIAAEQDIDTALLSRLNDFVEALPGGSVSEVIAVFADAQRAKECALTVETENWTE